jgi:hypothetical protein
VSSGFVVNSNGSVTVNAEVQVGESTSTVCGPNGAGAGTIRWNGTNFLGCNGSAWVVLGGVSASTSCGSGSSAMQNMQIAQTQSMNGNGATCTNIVQCNNGTVNTISTICEGSGSGGYQ